MFTLLIEIIGQFRILRYNLAHYHRLVDFEIHKVFHTKNNKIKKSNNVLLIQGNNEKMYGNSHVHLNVSKSNDSVDMAHALKVRRQNDFKKKIEQLTEAETRSHLAACVAHHQELIRLVLFCL